MKKHASLLAVPLILVASLSFANTLTIVNHTSVSLKLFHANGDNLLKSLPEHRKVTSGTGNIYHYSIHNGQEEYLSLAQSSKGSSTLFGLAADGIHGYVAPKYAYVWNNSVTHPKLTICETNKSEDCH